MKTLLKAICCFIFVVASVLGSNSTCRACMFFVVTKKTPVLAKPKKGSRVIGHLEAGAESGLGGCGGEDCSYTQDNFIKVTLPNKKVGWIDASVTATYGEGTDIVIGGKGANIYTAKDKGSKVVRKLAAGKIIPLQYHTSDGDGKWFGVTDGMGDENRGYIHGDDFIILLQGSSNYSGPKEFFIKNLEYANFPKNLTLKVRVLTAKAPVKKRKKAITQRNIMSETATNDINYLSVAMVLMLLGGLGIRSRLYSSNVLR